MTTDAERAASHIVNAADAMYARAQAQATAQLALVHVALATYYRSQP